MDGLREKLLVPVFQKGWVHCFGMGFKFLSPVPDGLGRFLLGLFFGLLSRFHIYFVKVFEE
jgi:hypothetical protein